MPLQISHLRRWFALGAIGMVLLVAGMYLYARHKVRNALKEVPEKIGLEVQQTAQGFTISRSEQGHTLFKVQASKAIQFKQGGRAELHDVAITLYGREITRVDQIYGSDFLYDPQSGDVTAQGEVQIDLEANPQGLAKPDQAVPKELKDPIYLNDAGASDCHAGGDQEESAGRGARSSSRGEWSPAITSREGDYISASGQQRRSCAGDWRCACGGIRHPEHPSARGAVGPADDEPFWKPAHSDVLRRCPDGKFRRATRGGNRGARDFELLRKECANDRSYGREREVGGSSDAGIRLGGSAGY